jgi:crossover junction endodeoxyribonuclease RuvC
VIVLALDLSLTGTGWATPDGTGTLSPPAKVGKGVERLVWLRDQVLVLAWPLPDLVAIEGAAFGQARGTSRLHAQGELSGVVRVALHELGVPIVDVPPAVVKRTATGKGNSPKEAVLAAAIRRLDFEGHSTDAADARWILEAVAHRYALEWRTPLPVAHLAKLETAVQWPELAP